MFRRRRVSISDGNAETNDFEAWIVDEFARTGAFTALVILVSIGGTKVAPLCSTYVNVIGDEIEWDEIVVLFAGSGMSWDGAAFFPVTASDGGPLDNPSARVRLRALEERVDQNRLILNDGHFFDRLGRRLMIEEAAAP
jgi:hypothetical protein